MSAKNVSFLDGSPYPLCWGYGACVDHDEELHEVVVDLAAPRLHDVHILPSHTLSWSVNQIIRCIQLVSLLTRLYSEQTMVF